MLSSVAGDEPELRASAAARTGHGDDVIGLEAVDDASVVVFLAELLSQLVVVEIGGEVGEAPLEGFVGPYLVAGVKEVADHGVGVDAVEGTVVETDVVEADVDGVDLEAAAVLFVVGVLVDVVVNREVVDHLGDGDVDEVAGVVGAPQVFGEYLHEHGLAHSYPTLQKNVFVELVTTVGEYILAQGAVVEVVEEEAHDILVVVVENELTALGREYY